jgi:hypothetical protein
MKKEKEKESKTLQELKEKINLFDKLKEELFPGTRLIGGVYGEDVIMRNTDSSICDLMLISKVKTVEDIKYLLDKSDSSNYRFINAVIFKFYQYYSFINNFEIKDRHVIGRMIADKFVEVTKNIALELTFVVVDNDNIDKILEQYFSDTSYRRKPYEGITDWTPFNCLMVKGLFKMEDLAWILKFRVGKLKTYDLCFGRNNHTEFLNNNKTKLLEPYILSYIDHLIERGSKVPRIHYLDVNVTCKERLRYELDIKLEDLNYHLENDENIIIHNENVKFMSEKYYKDFVSTFKTVKPEKIEEPDEEY